MRMKFNKKSGYTLAEIMIVLLLLTLVFAAFSPIITRRISRDRSGDIWTSTLAPDYDAFTEQFNPSDPGTMFFGVTPAAKQDIGSDAFLPSAKLVVRAGRLSNNLKQRHFQFRRGNRSASNGQTRNFAGSMIVDDNENMLLGSTFFGVTANNTSGLAPTKNVALGYGALDDLSYSNLIGYNSTDLMENLAHSNVAVGFNALNNLSIGFHNVAVGFGAGEAMTNKDHVSCNSITLSNSESKEICVRVLSEGYNSTFVGYNAGRNVKSVINMGEDKEGRTKYNDTSNNVAVGYMAFGKNESNDTNIFGNINATYNPTGKNNTFIGAYAGYNNMGDIDDDTKIGYNNIAIGYKAMGYIPSSSGTLSELDTNTTGHDNIAIGAHALEKLTTGSYNVAIGYGACSEVTTGSHKTCIGYNSGPHGGTKGIFYNNGNSTSAYFDGRKDNVERTYIGSRPYQDDGQDDPYFGGDAVLEIHNPTNSTSGIPLRANPVHLDVLATTNSIIPSSNTTTIINGNLIIKGRPYFTVGKRIYHFYDIALGNMYYGAKMSDFYLTYSTYPNSAFGTAINIPINREETSYLFKYTTDSTNEIDQYNKYKFPQLFCDEPGCTLPSSDRRLKNITGKFTAGLNELKNVTVYNYNFKNDKDKKQRVGVIAQQLQKVFPTAVFQGEDGYLKIRWDELFYAMLNGIKELDQRITALVKRTTKFDSQITKLEKENIVLKSQVDNLTQRVNKLKAQ